MYDKAPYGKVARISFAILSIIIAVGLYANVNATAVNWMPDSEVKITVSNNSNIPYETGIIGERQCTVQRIAVQGEIDLQDVCFVHGTNLSYGYYKGIYSYKLSVIKYKYDSKAYPIHGVGYADRTTIIPGTDTLISFHYRSDSDQNFTLTIQKNISRSLIKKQSRTGALESYALDSSNFKFVSNNPSYTWPVTEVGYSNNGKWLIANVTNMGMVRFNLETSEIIRFSPVQLLYYAPLPPINLSLAISNDGTHAALGGNGIDVPFKIYTIGDECAEVFNNILSPETIPAMDNPCPALDLRQRVNEKISGGYSYEKNISFSNDGGMINFYAYDAELQTGKWVEILSAGYSQPHLEYLALGDSYSSGEGDTQVIHKGKSYLAGTDVNGDAKTPREKCHISSRSYPFLLKDTMSIGVDMKSVACSGAEMERDYISSNTYRGQDNNGTPRLSNLLPGDLRIYQDAAQLNFIPGRVQQLEFIARYQPRVITITGGGNDVGFGSVILNCLSGLATCGDAQSYEGRARLAQEIMRQHAQLFNTYQAIKAASPNTKIYAVGYPQFINEQSLSCAPNVQLDTSERKLIVESVKFLNDIIEDAALNAGAKYVDIEDSLYGHRLCESGKSFVTGIAMLSASERQESFHPNHDGHQFIAKAISKSLGGETLIDYTIHSDQIDLQNKVSTEVPPYFKIAIDNTNRKYKHSQFTETNQIQKTSVFNITINNMNPGSRVAIEIHSDPKALGVYTVDNDGRLSVDITMPLDVLAGYHTLYLIGQTYSGEDIHLWQSIEVQGLTGDIDEDGISDEVDVCMYVDAVNVDYDGDNIDDGCDPLIEKANDEKLDKIVAIVRSDEHVINAQSINSTGVSQFNQNSGFTQGQVEELFYTPNHIKENQDGYGSTNINILSIVVGNMLFIIILIWLITRYSTYKDM